ncbi:MAG: bifunctional transaldolase/phosoglucose isomerase [Gammaproteobacteria bacterium]|nr:bifunctional transaldolase/phosoglucose isomerase [Gammaproteobacteria bacterium]
MTNPLIEIQQYGQSIWYDNIRRGLITSGELQRMIDDDGLLGVTSNPSIFEKALAGSPDYDQAVKALVAQGVGDAKDIYERLAIGDIQLAADVLYPTYERTDGRDGFISMEVSPYLAHDTQGTIVEARWLRANIGRDNVMIKVPATPEGLPAIRQLISEGININVTLLFAVDIYEAVANAYMEGLEQLAEAGGNLHRMASVASVFISRIDSLVDQKLCQALDNTRDGERRTKLKGLLGKVAIANAKVAYGRYQALHTSDRWQALVEKGARSQRLLWASTGTKNPKYPKTLYIDELIGPNTVNTVPAATFNVFRSEGQPRARLIDDWDQAYAQAKSTINTLDELGISIKDITDHLLAEGLRTFSESFDKLLSAVEQKRQHLLAGELAKQAYSVGNFKDDVEAALDDWRANGKVRRLWQGDAALWSDTDETDWLGWLDVVDGQREHADELKHIIEDVRAQGFRHVALLGMGGSSLCPEVMRRTFGCIDGFPELSVLDSTVPAQIQALRDRLDLEKTLFIVASKSGSTTEPNAFKQYFFDQLQQTIDNAGSHFVAITDPGSNLHKLAKQDRFRHIVHGVPSIGGRYSALSNFGLVPAAIMGVDVDAFLDSSEIMVQSCAASVPPAVNPGVALGLVMGTLAQAGRDKLTIVASPAIASLGAWLEQLIAESTGKEGKGIVPIDGEHVGAPEVYGQDRAFVYLRVAQASSPEQDAAVDALEDAGHPIIRIILEETMDLGQEFFRWQVATAVAGSVLGINPFNQPDVEASKIATRRLTSAFEQSGQIPTQSALLKNDNIDVFADTRNAEVLSSAAPWPSLENYLRVHLNRFQPGDYFAINAYVEMNEENHQTLQAIRHRVRDRKRVATTLGFGPRFLHSTGQLHKGGANNGVFLQITSDDAEDLPIPGQKYTFGILKRFQAQGDFEVLAERKRRALRVHLGPDVHAGLSQLRELVDSALA